MFRSPKRTLLCLTLTWACLGASRVPSAPAAPHLEAVRFWSFGDVTRIAIQTQGGYKLVSDQIEKPSRLYLDLIGLRPPQTAHRGIQTIRVSDRRIKEIRIAEVSPGRTRVVFDLEAPVEMISSQLVNPDRLMIELRPKGTSLPALASSRSTPVATANVTPGILSAEPATAHVPVTRSLAFPAHAPVEVVSIPPRAELSLPPIPPLETYRLASNQKTTLVTNQSALTSLHPLPVAGAGPSRPDANAGAAPALRTRNDSLVRVFGLKLSKVVIDAGHGGHDTGTIGPDGLAEKELVLDVALRLGKLVAQRLGAEVIYTRPDDTFIALEERTRIANNEKADLFLSIHANSSPEPTATGVETYFFNFTSDRHSVDLATRENAASSSSISDLGDLLHRAVLQAKLEESREFAQHVQSSLWASSVKINTLSRDRGVRQAPFVVLIGATMPSVLAEIGFVSNPHDERALQGGETRQKIAESLYKGIAQYAQSLSHSQLARAASQ